MPNEESEITTWELNQEITFGHEQYHANFWLTEFGLNGRYIAAPTAEGKVFVWNIKTAKLVAIIPTGQETGLRAVLFQPNQKRLFCAAEGNLFLWNESSFDLTHFGFSFFLSF